MPQYSLSRLLTVEEAADYLGMSSKSVDRHRRSGEIAYVQKGRYVRIRFGDLLGAIECWTHKIRSKAESVRRKSGAGVIEAIEKQEGGDRLIDAYGRAVSLAAEEDPIEDAPAPRRTKRVAYLGTSVASTLLRNHG